MNHRWARSLDGQNPAPVERQYILLFTGFLYVPGGAEFLPSTVPPYVDWVYHTYTFSTKQAFGAFGAVANGKCHLLWPSWSQMYHFGCPSFNLWVWAFGYEQKDLLTRGFSVWGVHWSFGPLTPSPRNPVRFEQKKGKTGKTLWMFNKRQSFMFLAYQPPPWK